MSEINYRQCKRCVMDTDDPNIYFDERGYCNYCNTYLKKKSEEITVRYDTTRLKPLIDKIKAGGKNKKYDCVLGISGGVDSCYLAYVLKNYGIRVLLVHMDNGWNSEEAVLNIKNVAARLGLDYESYVLDWEEFRDMQLAFLRASVIEAETPTDIAILGVLHRVAARYNVRYIISGSNNATEGFLPRYWHYNSKDSKYMNGILKKFGTKKIRKFPGFGFLTEVYYKFVKGIEMVYMLNFFDYHKPEAMKLLQEELGWKYYGGKHYESRYTKFVQSYLLPVKFRLDYRKSTLSNQIMEGKITREQALQELEKLSYDPATINSVIEYVAKKLAISTEELNAIIKLPPKTYRDYPNDEARLEFLYSLYRKAFQKKLPVSPQ